MGEQEKRLIKRRLLAMHLSDEDLLKMIRFNSQSVPYGVPRESLIDVCASGFVYGAMITTCPECKTILHDDGLQYSCFGRTTLFGRCRYFRLQVDTSAAPWEVPKDVANQDLKALERQSRNYPAESFINSEQMKRRDTVIKEISLVKNYHTVRHVDLVKSNEIPLIYFLVNDDDFVSGGIGKSSYCFGLVFKKQVNEDDKFVFYKFEKVYKEPLKHDYVCDTIQKVIERFNHQFLCTTGRPWSSWIDGSFSRNEGFLYPLNIDYYSTLDYLTCLKIDEIHEEIVLKLEYLKKMKIHGREITEDSIQKAQDTTLTKVKNAHVIYKLAKEMVESSRESMMSAMKEEFKFLCHDEKDRQFYSVVSRLLSSPVGTTIRLVDLPKKISLFEPVKKILSVFFYWLEVNEEAPRDPCHLNWPSSAAELTQKFMLEKIRDYIVSWIMDLAFSSDEQMHHHYVKREDSSYCYWSVLLRKARKAYDNSSSNCVIICTIDVEVLPEWLNFDVKHMEQMKLDMKNDKKRLDKQTDLEVANLYGIEEIYYDKCGNIFHSDNRVKVTMIFPIKYVEGFTLDHDEKHIWKQFLKDFYSSSTELDDFLIDEAFRLFKSKKVPFISLGTNDEKRLRRCLGCTL